MQIGRFDERQSVSPNCRMQRTTADHRPSELVRTILKQVEGTERESVFNHLLYKLAHLENEEDTAASDLPPTVDGRSEIPVSLPLKPEVIWNSLEHLLQNERVPEKYMVAASEENGGGVKSLPPQPPPPPPPPPPPLPPPITDCGRQVHQMTRRPTSGQPEDPLNFTSCQQNALYKNTMTPSVKLKGFLWYKAPSMRIAAQQENVWTKGAQGFSSYAVQEFEDLLRLFAAEPSIQLHKPSSSSSSVNSAESDGTVTPPGTLDRKKETPVAKQSGTLERKRKEAAKINLLEAKRSINVNIFLKQFRGGVTELVNAVRSNKAEEIGSEKLRSMMKILPEPDEIEALHLFSGDRTKLGEAEQFFAHLLAIPHYRLRVEFMLLQTECTSVVDTIKPSFELLIKASRELLKNNSLAELLYIILMIGNCLNAGTPSGNAVGFRLISLWNLFELRSNQPDVTLLHCVAIEAGRRNPALLTFGEQLPNLSEASKLSLDALTAEYRCLKDGLNRVSHESSKCGSEELRLEVNQFLDYTKKMCQTVDRSLKQLDQLRVQVAEFFCEEPQVFKLEDCFKVIASFKTKFAQAVQDNAERRKRESKRTVVAREACSTRTADYVSNENHAQLKSASSMLNLSGTHTPAKHKKFFMTFQSDRERPRHASVSDVLSSKNQKKLASPSSPSKLIQSGHSSGIELNNCVPKIEVESLLEETSFSPKRNSLRCQMAPNTATDLDDFLNLLEADKGRRDFATYFRRSKGTLSPTYAKAISVFNIAGCRSSDEGPDMDRFGTDKLSIACPNDTKVRRKVDKLDSPWTSSEQSLRDSGIENMQTSPREPFSSPDEMRLRHCDTETPHSQNCLAEEKSITKTLSSAEVDLMMKKPNARKFAPPGSSSASPNLDSEDDDGIDTASTRSSEKAVNSKATKTRITKPSGKATMPKVPVGKKVMAKYLTPTASSAARVGCTADKTQYQKPRTTTNGSTKASASVSKIATSSGTPRSQILRQVPKSVPAKTSSNPKKQADTVKAPAASNSAAPRLRIREGSRQMNSQTTGALQRNGTPNLAKTEKLKTKPAADKTTPNITKRASTETPSRSAATDKRWERLMSPPKGALSARKPVAKTSMHKDSTLSTTIKEGDKSIKAIVKPRPPWR